MSVGGGASPTAAGVSADRRPQHRPALTLRHTQPGSAAACLLPGADVAFSRGMLKLIGSALIARLLGFGLIGFIVIYLLFTLLT